MDRNVGEAEGDAIARVGAREVADTNRDLVRGGTHYVAAIAGGGDPGGTVEDHLVARGDAVDGRGEVCAAAVVDVGPRRDRERAGQTDVRLLKPYAGASRRVGHLRGVDRVVSDFRRCDRVRLNVRGRDGLRAAGGRKVGARDRPVLDLAGGDGAPGDLRGGDREVADVRGVDGFRSASGGKIGAGDRAVEDLRRGHRAVAYVRRVDRFGARRGRQVGACDRPVLDLR